MQSWKLLTRLLKFLFLQKAMFVAVRPHSKVGQYELLLQSIHSLVPSSSSALQVTTSLLTSIQPAFAKHTSYFPLNGCNNSKRSLLAVQLVVTSFEAMMLISQKEIFLADHWPRVVRCVSAAVRLLGLRVRMYVCPLWRRGLCDGPITRPKESYRCVCVCRSFSMISCNNNRLQLEWVGRKRHAKKRERKKESCAFPRQHDTALYKHRKQQIMFLF